jgi:hypothetical protein
MIKKIDDSAAHADGRRQPHRMRLPGFVGDEEIGLGDAGKRRAALNRWMTFGPRR